LLNNEKVEAMDSNTYLGILFNYNGNFCQGGKKLVDQVQTAMYVFIVNGRVGKDKLIGECTCQDVSMIDYFLSSSKLFFHILDFEIKNFSPNFTFL
jgi:hypothetical protein